MLATSTHDTKRSEDVRVRLDVISEIPAAWQLTVRRWSRLNRRHRREVDDAPAPARNDEYLFYQTLVGTLPVERDDRTLRSYRECIDAKMRKAAREAKLYTSWIAPNDAYEEALSQFVGAFLGRLDGNAFLDDLRSAAATFAWFGALNGVAMAALKLTSPGVPDFCQREETIELTLVDPDNRRAVDYARRGRALDHLQAMADAPDLAFRLHELLGAAVDGRAKLWTIWRALRLRREHPDLFAHGDYRPVTITGEHARCAIAFARRRGKEVLIVVAGRLYASLEPAVGTPPVAKVWADTRADVSLLPGHCRLVDALSGTSFDIDPHRPLPLAQLLAHFVVAIMWGEVPAAASA